MKLEYLDFIISITMFPKQYYKLIGILSLVMTFMIFLLSIPMYKFYIYILLVSHEIKLKDFFFFFSQFFWKHNLFHNMLRWKIVIGTSHSYKPASNTTFIKWKPQHTTLIFVKNFVSHLLETIMNSLHVMHDKNVLTAKMHCQIKETEFGPAVHIFILKVVS